MTNDLYLFQIGNETKYGQKVFLTAKQTEMPKEFDMSITTQISQAQTVETFTTAEIVAKAIVVQCGFQRQIKIHKWNPSMFDKTEVVKVI